MNRAAKSIVLIGMMGAGKSSVGRCLQRRIGLARFDTDEIVASKFGLSIPEIFSGHGEDRFREAETEALAGLAPAESAIIVTGGGIVLREENIELIKQLETAVRKALSGGSAGTRLAAVNTIAELGTNVRTLRDRFGIGHDFAADLANTVKNDPSSVVRAAAARAMGQILPDPKLAGQALNEALAGALPALKFGSFRCLSPNRQHRSAARGCPVRTRED